MLAYILLSVVVFGVIQTNSSILEGVIMGERNKVVKDAATISRPVALTLSLITLFVLVGIIFSGFLLGRFIYRAVFDGNTTTQTADQVRNIVDSKTGEIKNPSPELIVIGTPSDSSVEVDAVDSPQDISNQANEPSNPSDQEAHLADTGPAQTTQLPEVIPNTGPSAE